MQWNVQKIGAVAETHGLQGNRDMIVNRSDYVKGYHTTQGSAELAAKELATKHPGEQFGVFGIISIFETTKPNFVEKILNEVGEVVVKPVVMV